MELKCPESRISWYDRTTVMCNLSGKICIMVEPNQCEEYQHYLEEEAIELNQLRLESRFISEQEDNGEI